MIDLEEKSKELKQFVAQYEMSGFLGHLALMMQLIASPDKLGSLNGLTSPQRQLYYLAGLNISSSSEKANKIQFSNQEWDHIKKLLIEIEAGYNQFFYPKKEDVVDEEWKSKRRVAMPTFLSYFNQGHLNYEEQVIERVSEYFSPFDTQIKAHFGLSTGEFIEVYNYIDALPNSYLMEKINHKDGQEKWEDFATLMGEARITPDQWWERMPEHLKNYFEFMKDSGQMFRFSLQQLADEFSNDIAVKFLKALTAERAASQFLYYTEQNPLYIAPLFKVSDTEYQTIETKQLIHSVYNLLAKFCIGDDKLRDKFYAKRGDKLEEKIVKVFQKFFKGKATVYQGFYTQKGHEQDLLIIYNGTAFIIEAKASKRDEPRRNPDMAYDLILTNFDETIQKGYDQAYRVKEYFLDGQILSIYQDQKLTQHIIDINPKKIYNVFSVIVTLDRFGLIQADLNELLEIYDDDTFPWSICIDDLEVFLLTLTKQSKTLANLVHFLNLRQDLHGHVYCSDELEVCGAYLKGYITRKVADSEEVVAVMPDMGSVFDAYYHRGGLGFENEKNMQLKTNDKYFLIGVDSHRNTKATKR